MARQAENNQLTYVASSVSSNYQVELEINPELLQQGRYFLIVEALWNEFASDPNSEFRQFCVKMQSSIAV